MEHGLVLRFVAGAVTDPLQEAVLRAEERQYGDILRLPLQVGLTTGVGTPGRVSFVTDKRCLSALRDFVCAGQEGCTDKVLQSSSIGLQILLLLHPLVPMQEGYSSLPNKTRTFFKAVTDTWPHVDWWVSNFV